jgi:predicted permease
VNLEVKFIIFQIIIIIPFLAGFFINKKIENPVLISKKIILIDLIILEPVIIFWVIWGLTLGRDQLFLPAAGLIMVVTGFFLGKLSLPLINASGKSRVSFLISSSLANHGFTMGGFICYLLAGEKGLALSSIFLIYFIPYTVLVIFNYARFHSSGNVKLKLKDYIFNAQNFVFVAAIAALILNLSGIKRASVNFPIDPVVMAAVALNYFVLGININISSIKIIRADHYIISAIKFLIIPVITSIILQIVDLDRDIEKVILIQSFMPAAVYSVMTSILFDLDTELSSSIFIVNTLIFIVMVLPLLFMFNAALII